MLYPFFYMQLTCITTAACLMLSAALATVFFTASKVSASG